MTPMFVPTCAYPAPKVLLAGVGKRMTEAAGSSADGLLIHPFSTARYLRDVTLPAVARGRSAAGNASSHDFEIVSSAFIITGHTDEEIAASKSRVCKQLAFYGSTPAYRPVLEVHGWGGLGDELNRLSKGANTDKWQTMADLITDDVVAEFAITGSPESTGDQLLSRLGGMISSYEVNVVGINNADLRVEVAHSIQRAAQDSASMSE
jgi:probable F420-dependent oxidoreductase